MHERLLDFEGNFRWMQEHVYTTALEHGFHHDSANPLHVPTKLALIGSEVSEALEAHRNGEDEHLIEELADVVIRTMDMAASLNLDLASAIVNKARKNQTREFMHGNKRY